MSYDGWFTYNGVEIVNLSRTAQLAEALNISPVWLRSSTLTWLQDALGGTDYNDITEAPWYDPGYPASTEFAGVIPLTVAGLDDSTTESTPIEYITDGGNVGKSRNSTLNLVWSVVLAASTQRGAEFGRRWLDRVLHGGGGNPLYSGAELRYLRYGTEDSPQVHRRNVKISRGLSITRKRANHCSAMWTLTFTTVAADPFEYGDLIEMFEDLGGTVDGEGLVTDGDLLLTQEDCPVYDYEPIFDPLHPALVPPPSPPQFLPDGWAIEEGMDFTRYWATTEPVEPTALLLVPKVTLHSDIEARRVRVSIWPYGASTDSQCDALWSVIVNYLPPDVDFIVDGEAQASYTWDGSSAVRRADSLVYGPNAQPVQWTSFNANGLLVTLDLFEVDPGSDDPGSDGPWYEGEGTVRAALSLMPKSD